MTSGFSSPSSSSRSVSPPSTAPSTPPPTEPEPVYFLVVHEPTAAFLRSLPVKEGSRDRILFLSGQGVVGPLLTHAGDILAEKALLDPVRWERIETDKDDPEVAYYRTNTLGTFQLSRAFEPVDVEKLEVSTTKLSYADALNIFTDASLRTVISLSAASSTLHILERPTVVFPRLSLVPSTALNPVAHPFGPPALADFRDGWAAYDAVSLRMIPTAMLHTRPIDLRHKPLFYIGHLPTFANLLLAACTGEEPVGPARLPAIFERGIDPHVDDPEVCHRHSEVPVRDEDWPTLEEVLAYRDAVRARVAQLYAEMERGERALTRRLARTLVMVLEHDAFHIETLLYMLIQRAGTGIRPPPGCALPPWTHLAAQWDALAPPATPDVALGPCVVSLGRADPESADVLLENAHAVSGHAFGWDNESPRRAVAVGRIRMEWRPVTNGEFLAFYRGAGAGLVARPGSWVEDTENGRMMVRTLYGPVGMEVARHWPVLTAYDDLAAYAQAKGGRVPSEAELRLFLDRYNVGYEEGANTGFRNWHPLPATAGGEENGGRGSNGGVWEWTSTVLDGHDGFEGTTIFPGYSSDFFDGKHQVVLGASYATIPRLGDRSTVRNFYQHNYPYAWVGARVAYEV